MSNKICIMCNQDINDPYRLGEKITFKDVTVHYFCLLLSGNCAQNGADNEGILGFMPKDIKKEAQRAKKLRCNFCKTNGANISCCKRKCNKTFHLPCAIEHNYRFEFIGQYKSFCELHHDIKVPDICHKSTDLCGICFVEMGEYNVIQSIQSSCCQVDSWYHKICLQKYAMTAGYFLKCPMCNDSKAFRENIARRGIFIPNCDAKWEETGPNTFYGFDEQNAGPSECVADHCKMQQGRQYCYDENNEYLLVVCEHCGSAGVHERCMQKKRRFLCDDCKLEPPRKKRKITAEKDANNNQEHSSINNNIPNCFDSIKKPEASQRCEKFMPLQIKIKMPLFFDH